MAINVHYTMQVTYSTVPKHEAESHQYILFMAKCLLNMFVVHAQALL